jgi:group I intron endonuclease
MTTIYKYTNRINGKVYVGKTVNPRVRHNVHTCNARKGSPTLFARAIRKYGIESFIREFLCEIEELDGFVEMVFIAALKANNPSFGYNLTDGGEGITGYHHSEVTRQNQSRQSVGRVLSKEHCRHIALGLRGKNRTGHPRSVETRRKIANARLGKRLSPETILKRQIARYGVDYVSKGKEGIWRKYLTSPRMA